MSPDWDDTRIFAEVVRTGSFRQAAKKLRLTEPTVSRRIKRLEDAIGVQLFQRTDGRPQLTFEGRRVLSHVSAAEHALSKIVDVADGSGPVEGECKLIVGDGLGSYWLPPFLVPFLERNPNLQLLVFTTQDRASAKRAPYDLQIQYTEPLRDEQIAARLGSLHFSLFAARPYVAQFGIPATVDDLSAHRIIDLSLDLTDKGTLAAWGGLATRPSLFTNSNGVLGETMLRGGGIALLPTYGYVVLPQLVHILPSVSLRAPLYLTYSREAAKRPAVRAVIDYLKTVAFRETRMPWFQNDFVPPDRDWKRLYDEILADVREMAETPVRMASGT